MDEKKLASLILKAINNSTNVFNANCGTKRVGDRFTTRHPSGKSVSVKALAPLSGDATVFESGGEWFAYGGEGAGREVSSRTVINRRSAKKGMTDRYSLAYIYSREVDDGIKHPFENEVYYYPYQLNRLVRTAGTRYSQYVSYQQAVNSAGIARGGVLYGNQVVKQANMNAGVGASSYGYLHGGSQLHPSRSSFLTGLSYGTQGGTGIVPDVTYPNDNYLVIGFRTRYIYYAYAPIGSFYAPGNGPASFIFRADLWTGDCQAIAPQGYSPGAGDLGNHALTLKNKVLFTANSPYVQFSDNYFPGSFTGSIYYPFSASGFFGGTVGYYDPVALSIVAEKLIGADYEGPLFDEYELAYGSMPGSHVTAGQPLVNFDYFIEENFPILNIRISDFRNPPPSIPEYQPYSLYGFIISEANFVGMTCHSPLYVDESLGKKVFYLQRGSEEPVELLTTAKLEEVRVYPSFDNKGNFEVFCDIAHLKGLHIKVPVSVSTPGVPDPLVVTTNTYSYDGPLPETDSWIKPLYHYDFLRSKSAQLVLQNQQVEKNKDLALTFLYWSHIEGGVKYSDYPYLLWEYIKDFTNIHLQKPSKKIAYLEVQDWRDPDPVTPVYPSWYLAFDPGFFFIQSKFNNKSILSALLDPKKIPYPRVWVRKRTKSPSGKDVYSSRKAYPVRVYPIKLKGSDDLEELVNSHFLHGIIPYKSQKVPRITTPQEIVFPAAPEFWID